MWLDYFFIFLEKCYVNGVLTDKLEDCHKKSADAIGLNSSKLEEQKKLFDSCILGYEKSSQTVKSDTILGSYLLENYLFKERFLPGVPSLRINEQSLAVSNFSIFSHLRATLNQKLCSTTSVTL